MPTINTGKEGAFIIDQGSNTNIDGHQEDGAAWNPTIPDMKVEGGFTSTILPGDTYNYIWNNIGWEWEYFSGDTDPSAELLVQLVGIKQDLNESQPIYEYSTNPSYPFSVSESKTIQLGDSVGNPNLSILNTSAGAGKIRVNLPVRWSNYLNAVLSRPWLTDYTKRKPWPLTSTNTMYNQPVLVTITYDSDMQTDFDDIRFTDADGITELDYELVSKTDSTSAIFWVQTVENTGTEYIFVYYGNSSVTSASEPFDVWDYYDNFEDNLLTGRTDPYDDISVNAGTTSITSTSPIFGTYSLKHIGTGGDANLGFKYTNNVVSDNFSLIFTVKCTTQGTGANTPYISLTYLQYTSYQNWLRLVSYYEGSNQKLALQKCVSGTTTNYSLVTLMSGRKWNTNEQVTFRIDRIDVSTWKIYKIQDGVQTLLINTTGNPGHTSIFGFGCQMDTQAYWDNIKYHESPTDPYEQITVGSIGAEESTPNITYDSVSDETQQYITFTTPSDWTLNQPAYLILTDLDNNQLITHECNMLPTNTVSMTPHCPTGFYALRLKFTIKGTDEMAVNITSVNASYEYLEDLK